MESEQCAVCGKAATKFCGHCWLSYYCCRDHQVQHWSVHRTNCRPFKVEHNERLGQYLVASRDLKERELLVCEEPLLKGPAFVSPPVCLGCYVLLPATPVPCTRCGWPMCSAGCADSPDHVPECRILTDMRKQKVTINESGKDTLPYDSVKVLRALLLRETDPERWKKLFSCQSNCRVVHESGRHRDLCVSITQSLHNFFKYTEFSEEDIHEVIGILMVNSFGKAKLTYASSSFQWASLAEHSCCANCFYSINNAGNLILCTARAISRGENLSISHVDMLKGREMRRESLYSSKLFWCRCARCVDPTDLGTLVSALYCPQPGCGGPCLPNKEWLKLELANIQDEPPWTCQKCQKPLPSVKVRKILQKAASDFRRVDATDPKQCLEFLRQQELAAQLAPHHHYMWEMRLQLATRLGSGPGELEVLSDWLLNLKETFCRNLMNLICTVCPGEHCKRARLLYALLVTILEKERRASKLREIDPWQTMTEKRSLVLETIDLLKYEPEEGENGKIMEQSRIFLHTLNAMVNLADAFKNL